VIVGREEIQRQEAATLAQYAVHSSDSRGRRYPEPEDPYRTAFQRDRDRIIHCSAYRRLGNETQVFFSCEGEQYRTWSWYSATRRAARAAAVPRPTR
jgi:dGTPase